MEIVIHVVIWLGLYHREYVIKIIIACSYWHLLLTLYRGGVVVILGVVIHSEEDFINCPQAIRYFSSLFWRGQEVIYPYYNNFLRIPILRDCSLLSNLYLQQSKHGSKAAEFHYWQQKQAYRSQSYLGRHNWLTESIFGLNWDPRHNWRNFSRQMPESSRSRKYLGHMASFILKLYRSKVLFW